MAITPIKKAVTVKGLLSGRRAGWLDSPALGPAFLLLLLGGVFLVSFLYQPPAVPRFTVCLFKNMTGLDCPGCGLTRSFCALSRGDLGAAFYFNKLGPFIYGACLILWLRAALALAGWRRPVGAIDRALGWLPVTKIALAAFLLYGAARLLLHFAGYHI